MSSEWPLPSITRTYDEASGDQLWTLRIPRMLMRDVYHVERLKRRLAAQALRLVAHALDELDVDAPGPPAPSPPG